MKCNNGYSSANVSQWVSQREQRCKTWSLCFAHSLSLQHSRSCECVITSSLLQTKARPTTAVSYWSCRATRCTRDLEYFHSSEPEHQEMIWDPLEQEDKSYSVSHILSPFPSLSPSLNQLSWLMYAHSCPNHWSPDMTKACTEEGNRGGSASGSVTGRSIGLSGEERRLTVICYPKSTTPCFHIDVNKSLSLPSKEEPLFSDSSTTQQKHMDWRTNKS